MTTVREAGPEAVTLTIVLEGLDPPVWRRVCADSAMTLHGLHRFIQIVMSWEDRHLYAFHVAGETVELPEDESADAGDNDPRGVRLSDLTLEAGDELRYVYDWGDDWEHRIAVEGRGGRDKQPAPRVVDGAGAAPPEDVGAPTAFAGSVRRSRGPITQNAGRPWRGPATATTRMRSTDGRRNGWSASPSGGGRFRGGCAIRAWPPVLLRTPERRGLPRRGEFG